MESLDKKIQYKQIAEQIIELFKVDQDVRKQQNKSESDYKRWKEIDIANAKTLKNIIAEIGWPTISKVGSEASHDAWLIAQHADHDVEFQKKCLELMRAEPENEVSEQDIAYLHDRICVNEGKPQFFGTQFYTNENGAYGPRPIEQIETVDERREKIGLQSLEEYKKELEVKYFKKE